MKPVVVPALAKHARIHVSLITIRVWIREFLRNWYATRIEYNASAPASRIALQELNVLKTVRMSSKLAYQCLGNKNATSGD